MCQATGLEQKSSTLGHFQVLFARGTALQPLSTVHAPHGPTTPCTPARSGRRTRGAVRKIGPRRRGRRAVARLNISSSRCKIAWALHEAHAWELQWCFGRRRDRNLRIKYWQEHHLAPARPMEDAVWSRAASALGAPRMDMASAVCTMLVVGDRGVSCSPRLRLGS